jgi:hypothetical protein
LRFIIALLKSLGKQKHARVGGCHRENGLAPSKPIILHKPAWGKGLLRSQKPASGFSGMPFSTARHLDMVPQV